MGPLSSDPARAEIAELLWGRGRSGLVTQADVVAAAAEHLVVFLERACAASPVVLVCDDLQWADTPSLMIWARLARLAGQMPLLLIASIRPVPRREEVAQLRRRATEQDAVVIELGPLGEGPVEEMVGHLGAPPGPLLRARAAQASEIPFTCARWWMRSCATGEWGSKPA